MQEYTTEQILSFLSENEIFQQAPEFSNFLKEDFEDFLEITQITTIQKGGTVFTKGDKANSILLILRGEVGIFEAESTGKLTPVATVAERSFVGEMGIIDESTRSATVIASTECLLATILAKDFWLYFKLYPALAINLVKVINKRFKKRYETEKKTCCKGADC